MKKIIIKICALHFFTYSQIHTSFTKTDGDNAPIYSMDILK